MLGAYLNLNRAQVGWNRGDVGHTILHAAHGMMEQPALPFWLRQRASAWTARLIALPSLETELSHANHHPLRFDPRYFSDP